MSNGQVIVVFNTYRTTNKFIEEIEAKKTDLYGPQEMALRLLKHLTDTACVLQSYAGLSDCRPLNFLKSEIKCKGSICLGFMFCIQLP